MEERVLKHLPDERTAVDVRQVSKELDVKLVSWQLIKLIFIVYGRWFTVNNRVMLRANDIIN